MSGHVSRDSIEVDKAKIDLISTFPPLTSVKDICSFWVIPIFIVVSSNTSLTRLLTHLLSQDVPFFIDSHCHQAFEKLKVVVTSAPIIQAPDWNLPFEVMCDASDFALGAVLGQRKETKSRVIYYASKTLYLAQINYTTTEKELLAIVFAFDKFRSYLIGTKVIVFSNHSLSFLTIQLSSI